MRLTRDTGCKPPQIVVDLAAWVRVVLRQGHRSDPDRFPGVPEWSHEDEWSTETERELRAKLRRSIEERDRAVQRFANEASSMQSQLAAAQEAADMDERMLITGTGDELTAAVLAALTEFGFLVVDADAEADEGDHLEDLRVTDPDAPGWIALVEVKGYSKGAKTEALTQFLRFQKRHQQRTGRVADAEWYVVNQFRGRDPATRQLVLNGKDADVEAFGSGGGLVLDTVELFRLRSDVRGGKRTAAEARNALRTATGRWKS
jgi:hypothetical protein